MESGNGILLQGKQLLGQSSNHSAEGLEEDHWGNGQKLWEKWPSLRLHQQEDPWKGPGMAHGQAKDSQGWEKFGNWWWR